MGRVFIININANESQNVMIVQTVSSFSTGSNIYTLYIL